MPLLSSIRTRSPGLTLIETMVLVAVLGIALALVLPRLQEGLIRGQVADGLHLAATAQAAIAAAWERTHALPADNAAAGLPPPGDFDGQEVSSLTVEGGAIQLRFGRRANAAINGRVLSLRPAVVGDALDWVCGDAAAPAGRPAAARPQGANRTDVPERFLPPRCRGGD